jgi:hypothetical protein
LYFGQKPLRPPVAAVNLNPMPEQPNDYEPTEADIDMIVEDVTGKRVKPANLAAGIASMRQRVAQLETEKTKLLDRMDEDSNESLKDHLAAVNKDLATARERLTHYEAQLGRQN